MEINRKSFATDREYEQAKNIALLKEIVEKQKYYIELLEKDLAKYSGDQGDVTRKSWAGKLHAVK